MRSHADPASSRPGHSSPTNRTRFPVALLLRLIGFRLVWIVLIGSSVDLAQDEEFYDDIARSLLAGRGFTHDPAAGPNLWREPLYPLFLAGLLVIPLPLWLTAPVAQTLLGAATSWLTFLVFRPAGRCVALLAAALTWLNPVLVYYSLRFLSESLFTFLLMATLVMLQRPTGVRGTLDAGVLCGAAILCRRSLIGFVVPAALWLAGTSRGPRRVRAPALFILAVLVSLSPWFVRNWSVSGHLTLGTGAAYNFWLGNHQPTLGLDTDQLGPIEARALEDKINRISGGWSRFAPEAADAFAEAAWAEMRAHPLGFVLLLLRKIARFWFGVYGPGRQWLQPPVVAFQVLFLAACVLGVVRTRWSESLAVGLFLLLVGYFMVVHVLTVATLRYMVPLLPLLSGFVAVGVAQGWSRLRGGR